MNEAGNEGGSVTVELPDYDPCHGPQDTWCPSCGLGERKTPMTNDFDETAIRSTLTKLRKVHGANTPAGHRISNLLEQLENRAKSTDRQQIRNLEKLISQSVAELAALTSPSPKGERA